MSFRMAFDIMINKKGRPMTLLNRDTSTSFELKVAPTNYQRNLEGPSGSVFEGREWIISKSNLTKSGFTGILKRNLRLQDAELGEMTVREIIEMYDLFGQIIGYRIRTD